MCSRSEALADLSQLEGSTCYVSPFKPPGTLPPLPRAGSGAAARAGGGGGVARRGSLVWDRGVDPDLDLDLQLHQIQEQDDSGDGSGGGGRNTADECRGPALRSTLSGHDRPSATPYTASGKATAAAQGQAHVGFGLPPLSNKVAAGLLSGTGAAAAAGAGSPQWLDASGGRVHADTGVTCSGGLGASLLPTANSADCRSGGSGGSSSSLGPAAAATAACSSMPSRATSLQAAGGANGSSGSGAPTSSSTLRSGPSGKAWPAALLALLGSNTSGGGKAAGDGRGFSGKAAASASVAVAKGSQPLEPQAQRHGKPLQPQPPGSFFRFDRGSSLSEPIADFPPLSAPRSTWLPQLPLFACLCGASAAGEGRHTGGGSGCNDGIGIDTVPCKQADVLVDSHAAAHDLRPGSVLGAHDVAAGKVSLLRPS